MQIVSCKSPQNRHSPRQKTDKGISPWTKSPSFEPARPKPYCMPYLFLNLSTRPAVSISFCLPVKKGWQAEQISVVISDLVERVKKVLPHKHLTVISLYLGWIPSLITFLLKKRVLLFSCNTSPKVYKLALLSFFIKRFFNGSWNPEMPGWPWSHQVCL
jgi:hypothetical protein